MVNGLDTLIKPEKSNIVLLGPTESGVAQTVF